MPKLEETKKSLKKQQKPLKLAVKISESFKGVNVSQEIKEQKALKSGTIKEKKTSKSGTIKEKKTIKPRTIKEQKTSKPGIIKEKKTSKPGTIKEQKTLKSEIIKEQKPLKSGTIKKEIKPKHTKIKVGELPTSLKRVESNLFLIKKDILSPTFLKVIKVNEALKRGDALTIKDALEEFDLDRSLYYKYRNSIFPFYEATKEEIVTFLFSVEHKEGVLASIINLISDHLGNILTINQGFPTNGIATINISVDLTLLNINAENLINRLKNLKDVREMEILGRVKS